MKKAALRAVWLTKISCYLLFLAGFLASHAAKAQNANLFSAPTTPLLFQDALTDGTACPYCPKLVMLSPGSFVMGAMPGIGHNNERTSKNMPLAVEIENPFAMSIYEVTRREFAAFVEANPKHNQQEGCAGLFGGAFENREQANWKTPGFSPTDVHPVVCVSWRQADAYTRWLSKITGATYRLPTESEWEYAARAGSAGRFWWGERMEPAKANCLHNQCGDSFEATAPAEAFEANPFGLFNMQGNVWEWTADCYIAEVYNVTPHHFPRATQGPKNCKRVIRGGSWSDNAWVLRSSIRESWKPNQPLNDLGFRVVRISNDNPL